MLFVYDGTDSFQHHWTAPNAVIVLPSFDFSHLILKSFYNKLLLLLLLLFEFSQIVLQQNK